MRKKSVARVEAGRRNIKNGKNIEEHVKMACEVYKKENIAWIDKNSEPMQIVKALEQQGGFYLARFAQKAKPDFEGVLRGGRAILFDVKSTEEDQIKASVLSKGQAQYLEQYHKMGAVSAVLVCLQPADFFMVPWNVWKNMKIGFGHLHMTREELVPYRVNNDTYVHFLEKIIEEVNTDNFKC